MARVRVALYLSEDDVNKIKEIARFREESYSLVIRKAISTEYFLHTNCELTGRMLLREVGEGKFQQIHWDNVPLDELPEP